MNLSFDVLLKMVFLSICPLTIHNPVISSCIFYIFFSFIFLGLYNIYPDKFIKNIEVDTCWFLVEINQNPSVPFSAWTISLQLNQGLKDSYSFFFSNTVQLI